MLSEADGVTVSGGEPFLQTEELWRMVRYLRGQGVEDILVYTGYTLEECLSDPARRACLRWIDTLVEGRYVATLRDPALRFRGSSNQRVIDIAALHLSD